MNHWATWAFFSALFAGLTAILAKVGVQGIDSNLATAIRTTVILLFTWLLAAPALKHTHLLAIRQKTWLFLVLSGLATGSSWLCYYRALQLGKVSQVAPVDKLSVVVAIVLGVLFLGERLDWAQGIAVAFIGTGVMILALR
jgi:transporter family protein